jgi:hypothetical protein
MGEAESLGAEEQPEAEVKRVTTRAETGRCGKGQVDSGGLAVGPHPFIGAELRLANLLCREKASRAGPHSFRE